MLVSVIIPVFNRETTIRHAVESVFAQTYAPIELIVVDDGSSDRTVEVLAGYGSRLRLIRQENAGAGAARNTGIRAANGAIVAFLDSDDLWHRDKLSRQVALMRNTAAAGVTCCICNARMLFADGRQKDSFNVSDIKTQLTEGIWTNPTEVLITRFLLFNQVVAIWRDALDDAGYFSSEYRVMEDHDLALRLSRLGPWAFISDPLATWHGGSENSLTRAAKSSDVARHEHDMLTRFHHSMPADSRRDRLVRGRLQVLRWRMSALEFCSRPKRFDRAIGRLCLRALKYYDSYRRRHYTFPRMIARPVPVIEQMASSSPQGLVFRKT